MAVKSVKSVDHQVKEFVKRVSDDDLKWVSIRLKERVDGDVSEVAVLFQDKYGDLNRLLNNAQNSFGVYDVFDIIDRSSQDEVKRRFHR